MGAPAHITCSADAAHPGTYRARLTGGRNKHCTALLKGVRIHLCGNKMTEDRICLCYCFTQTCNAFE